MISNSILNSTLPGTYQPTEQQSPEIQLLLHCARTHLSSATKTAIQDLLTQSLDWSCLIETAIHHGVAGLLYQNLQKIDVAVIPKPILSQLLIFFQRSTLHSILLTKELLKLLPLFAAQGIPVIPFKGPLLSTALYQNLGLRQTSDLDLLVPPEYFQQAIDLLKQLGYASKRKWTFLNPKREARFIQEWHEYSLIKDRISIDLHQALTPGYFLSKEPSFEQLWQNRQEIPLAGNPVWSFGTEDLLIYLTIHGSKECWRALKWICDIAEFVRTYPDTNWATVVAKAKALSSERMLLIGFQMAHLLLDLAVPPEIQQGIEADATCIIIAQELAQNLFAPDPHLTNKFSVKKTLLHFRMMQNLRDRLNCLTYLQEPLRRRLTVIFPNDQDGAFFPLPPRLHFLYCVLRPIRLMMMRTGLLKSNQFKAAPSEIHPGYE